MGTRAGRGRIEVNNCSSSRQASWKNKEEWDKGKNPFIFIPSKQKEWRELVVEVFCPITNGRQGEGTLKSERRLNCNDIWVSWYKVGDRNYQETKNKFVKYSG